MKFVLAVLMGWMAASTAQADERWAVYYGNALQAEDFASFDLIVLDAEHSGPVAPLKAQGKTVLGYLSLGEAESYRPYYKEIKHKKLVLAKNPQWPDHRVIDIRNPAWEAMVSGTLIPQLLAQGFDGVMFDTIDSPLHMERLDAKRYAGMGKTAADVICSIRAEYPDMKIMLNRGFEILPQVAGCIDMVMAETTRSDLQPKDDKKPYLTAQADYEQYVATLKEAQVKNPALKVYSLDYWTMEDRAGVARIYNEQRAQGFIPYVATIDLQKIYTEPY